MVDAMDQSTPRQHKKSRRIRTEKIDFVLTQICDIRVYPVLMRVQPPLSLTFRATLSARSLNRVSQRLGAPATGLDDRSAGPIGGRVKRSRSHWTQGCNMTYHLQKQIKRPLDRKYRRKPAGGIFYGSNTVNNNYVGCRNKIPFQAVL